MQGFDQDSSTAQIISDFNLTSAQPVYNQVAALFASYADKVYTFPRLQDLYTRRQVAANLLGSVWAAVDFVEAGVDEKDTDYTANLQGLYDNYDAEIKRLESIAQSNRTPATAMITATAPVMSRHRPNPNYRGYGGDPKLRTSMTRPPF